MTAEANRNWMIGRAIERVYADNVSRSWRFEFTDGGSLRVDSLWRVLAHGRAAVSSGDAYVRLIRPELPDFSTAAKARLRSHKIKGAFVRPESGDLVLELEGNVTLEAVVISALDENWKLHLPNGAVVITLRDGKVQVLPTEPEQET
jgi:hypothetical protein